MYRDLSRISNSSRSKGSRSRKYPVYYIRRLIYHLRRGELVQSLKALLNRVFWRYCWRFAYSSIPRHASFVRRRINYIQYVRWILARVEFSHVPKIYPGGVLYFLSEDRKQYFDDINWRDVAGGGLEVRIVPGYHSGILQEPNVRILAEHLRERLDDVQADVPEGDRSGWAFDKRPQAI